VKATNIYLQKSCSFLKIVFLIREGKFGTKKTIFKKNFINQRLKDLFSTFSQRIIRPYMLGK